MLRAKRFLLFVLIVVVTIAGPAWMGTQRAEAATPLTKLGRGIMNIIMAPIEIPWAIANPPADLDPVSGAFLGVFTGTGRGLTRLTAGVLESVTFLVPRYDDALYPQKIGDGPPFGRPLGEP